MGKSKVYDCRPIGERAYTQQCIKHLISFLSSHYYDRALSPKLLTVPTKKDFEHIVLFLFQQIDPEFEFNAQEMKEDVRNYFKSFGYPFNISKSSLAAVGSPHTWPSLLAALIWVVQVLEYSEQVDELEKEEKDEAKVCQKMVFNYCKEAYHSFLAGNDSYDDLDAALGATFDEKNKSAREEIERYREENVQMQR